MQERQSQEIKELIRNFPEAGAILKEYGIDCGTCSVGVCQLQDVLEIHSLPDEKAKALMARIEFVINDAPHGSAQTSGSLANSVSAAAYTPSAAMATLMREHVYIQRFISLVPQLVSHLDLHRKSDRESAGSCLDFITRYADSLHHGKEEDILFRFFDTTEAVFQVMFEEHTQGRGIVSEMRSAISSGSTAVFATNLLRYRDLLREHIKKEDTLLFPWLDRRLTSDQKQQMNARFTEIERENDGAPQRYERFVEELENVMLSESVVEGV